MTFQFNNQQSWNPQYPGFDMNFDLNQQHQTSFNQNNPHNALNDCIVKDEDCEVIEDQLFNSENLKNLQFQFNNDVNEHVPVDLPNFSTHSVTNSSDLSHSPLNGINDVLPLAATQAPKSYPSPQQTQNNTSSNDEFLSEEELLKRRKAQNRAAQRAFRERKEMKLKELEDKLNKSEKDRTDLVTKLEDLRKRNIVIQTENKILLQNTQGNIPMELSTKEHDGSFSFPTRDEFYSNHANFLKESKLSTFQHNINHHTDNGHETVSFGVNGVWEFVNEYNEKNDEDIDANLVIFKLKGKEVCKVNGPAYDVGFVIETLQQVIEEQHGSNNY